MSAPTIDPRAVYTIATLTDTLGLKAGTLPRELRLGRLRYAKRSGRVWILGRWVLDWLQAGEVRKERRRPAETLTGNGEGAAMAGCRKST